MLSHGTRAPQPHSLSAFLIDILFLLALCPRQSTISPFFVSQTASWDEPYELCLATSVHYEYLYPQCYACLKICIAVVFKFNNETPIVAVCIRRQTWRLTITDESEMFVLCYQKCSLLLLWPAGIWGYDFTSFRVPSIRWEINFKVT